MTLANYHACVTRLHAAWPTFLKTRDDRLRHGDESEKVAEAIIEDMLTGVLDWGKGDLVYQIEYADIVLSQNLQNYQQLVLVLEQNDRLAQL